MMLGTGMITFGTDLVLLLLGLEGPSAPIVKPLAAYLNGSRSSSPSSLNLAGLLSKLPIDAWLS